MKTLRIIILMTLFAAMFVGSAMADRERPKKKLPVGSYITSAKIEILSQDPERIEAALEFLSDLSYFYGPHSEAYYWKAKIYVDYVDAAPSPKEKKPHLQSLIVLADSLRTSCDNKEIKKKYRKNCDEYTSLIDSVLVMRQREFFNDGVAAVDQLADAQKDMEVDPDTAMAAYYEEKMVALRDTAQSYFELSLTIDSTDARSYLAIGNMLAQANKLDEANVMLEKALPSSEGENKANMLVQIAYNYVNNGKYCESIPFFRQYLDEFGSEDVANMINMSAIYNNCDKPDSALHWYEVVLGVDSTNIEALSGVGSYYRLEVVTAIDSARTYGQADDKVNQAKWQALVEENSEKSRASLKRAFDIDTTNAGVAGEYGLLLYIIDDYEAAVAPFKRLTELNPSEKVNWVTLGNCYLKMKEFDKCARAYEAVVEIDPDNRTIWEKLEGLYKELKETENLKRAQEHLK